MEVTVPGPEYQDKENFPPANIAPHQHAVSVQQSVGQCTPPAQG